MSTRRLAAIMFTDIVGYSRMMQESEQKATQIRKRHREVFEQSHGQFQGQILQYYGDGTLSIFDSCVQAVQCAIDIQQHLQQEPRVPLRIGIHLGDIVQDESDILGDGVNVAARIESLGIPGSVLISGEVQKQVHNHGIQYVSLGSFELKNIARPVEVLAINEGDLAIPTRKEMVSKIPRKPSSSSSLLKGSKWIGWVAVGFVAMAIGATLFWTIIAGTNPNESKEAKIKWAYQTAIPQIERLVDNLYVHQKQTGYGPDAWQAFQLVQEVESILPDDPRVQELKKRCSRKVYISSNPPGAKVSIKSYSQKDSAFQYIGETPIKNKAFPSSLVCLKIEKEGYETIRDVILVSEVFNHGWKYALDSMGTIPQGMSRVRPNADTLQVDSIEQFIINSPDEFLIDTYEVSNQEYKAFVDTGGYQNPIYWQEDFVKEGKELSWEEAMSEFVDQTGRPGPSTWIGGTFPEGEENYPVEGVSWYEAVAYAQFVGKQLPSRDHIQYVSGGFWVVQEMMGSSHLNANGSRERTQELGENLWGVRDIYGNAREWCYNRVGEDLRSIIGASFDDEDYLANDFRTGRSPFDRSGGNGFRCIQSVNFPNYQGAIYRPILDRNLRNFTKEKPVSKEVFEGYLNFFVYDKREVQPKMVYSREERYWTREKVKIETPSGKEQMAIYVFLPKNASPPYQTILYWPGATANRVVDSEEFLEIGQVDFFVKNGRALIMPIFTGTYERRRSAQNNCQDRRMCERNNRIIRIKEVRKALDFIESRPDLDEARIGYVGKSWGAWVGPIPMAVDKRIQAGILHLGGLPSWRILPEVDPINYCPRMTQPVLMLNGRYDNVRPYKEVVLPMYNLLGTAQSDKILKLSNDAHMIPRKQFIREGLAFFDRYLGPEK